MPTKPPGTRCSTRCGRRAPTSSVEVAALPGTTSHFVTHRSENSKLIASLIILTIPTTLFYVFVAPVPNQPIQVQHSTSLIAASTSPSRWYLHCTSPSTYSCSRSSRWTPASYPKSIWSSRCRKNSSRCPKSTLASTPTTSKIARCYWFALTP